MVERTEGAGGGRRALGFGQTWLTATQAERSEKAFRHLPSYHQSTDLSISSAPMLCFSDMIPNLYHFTDSENKQKPSKAYPS